MTQPNVLQAPTKLYSATEPEGRLFQAGEPWPGDAWSAKPGGQPAGANAAAGLMKDLAQANKTNEQLGRQLASKDHDLAQLAAQRDEAAGKVADLEQRAIAAEKARAEADAAATAYMKERDQARSDLKAAQDKIAAMQTPSEPQAASA